MPVAFVFLDGVGLGDPGKDNPLSTLTLPALAYLANGQAWTAQARTVNAPHHVFRPLDATLGVPGLPQSGTGQTALFAGFNAAQVAGRHFGPFPHSATRARLEAESLFARLHGRGCAFLNAYPDRFFSYNEQTDRWSTTTRMCRAAGVALRTQRDLQAGHALAADLTGQGWRDGLGLDTPVITPAQAGMRLHALARQHRVTLFEYFLTDKAGHGRGGLSPAAVLADVDAFLDAYLALFDPGRDTLVVTSDHGNIEALGTKSHTRNPVPLAVLGRGAEAFGRALSLTDVTPALVRLAEA